MTILSKERLILLFDDVVILSPTNCKGPDVNDLQNTFPKLFYSKKSIVKFLKENGNHVKTRDKKFVCHYCEKQGHVTPFCVQKKKDLRAWKINVDFIRSNNAGHMCNVVYAALKTNITGTWYFDSGCSSHMIGDNLCLSDFIPIKWGRVTYGGGTKDRIVGKWTLNIPNFSDIKNILYWGINWKLNQHLSTMWRWNVG